MKNKHLDAIYNGLLRENPIFVLMLGMCPTLAVTTSAINGAGMGISTTVVLILSNMLIAALRKIIPDGVRMPAYIVVVATFVTLVDFIMEAFTYSLYQSLGLYIPLIVVNCIILGRAEAYASKNTVTMSACDGIGMGLGFTVALLILDRVDLSPFAYATENGTSKILGPLLAGVIQGYVNSILVKASAYSGGTDFISAIIHKHNPSKSVFGLTFTMNVFIAIASYLFVLAYLMAWLTYRVTGQIFGF